MVHSESVDPGTRLEMFATHSKGVGVSRVYVSLLSDKFRCPRKMSTGDGSHNGKLTWAEGG